MANKKQQPAKKRAYVKKTYMGKNKDSKEAIANIELLEPQKPAPIKDNEIELLALLISVFDNWSAEQKQRNLKFLCSKYYDFL